VIEIIRQEAIEIARIMAVLSICTVIATVSLFIWLKIVELCRKDGDGMISASELRTMHCSNEDKAKEVCKKIEKIIIKCAEAGGAEVICDTTSPAYRKTHLNIVKSTYRVGNTECAIISEFVCKELISKGYTIEEQTTDSVDMGRDGVELYGTMTIGWKG